MADPYVIFPGTPGDYLSTADVNLLDADTAHLEQSTGDWIPAGSLRDLELSTDLPPKFGDFHGKCVVNTDASTSLLYGSGAGTGAVPASALTEYGMSMWLGTDQPDMEMKLEANCRTGTGGAAGAVLVQDWTPLSADAFQEFGGPFTTVAATGFVIPIVTIRAASGNMSDGDAIYFDRFCFRLGSDPTFVPSLRIVSTLYEEIVPVDMPISFAADGSPLTVGEGWAGNGYSYNRYDGADSSAPLVASFQAGDVPVAAQLPG